MHCTYERADYQHYEWKRALDRSYVIKSPIGHGWKQDNGNICIEWMTEKPAPEAMLEFVSCNCKKNKCQSGSSNCKSLDLVCTDACGCSSCENFTNEHDTDSEEDSLYSSDSSDGDDYVENDDLID